MLPSVAETPENFTPESDLFERLRELEVANRQLKAEIAARDGIEEELREAKEQAELASRAKTEFLANMSHELRTPLNAVMGFSEVIRDEMFGPVGSPKYRAYARDIHASGSHLLALINDILDVAKIEAGRRQLNEAELDLKVEIEAAVGILRGRAEAAGLELLIEIEPNLPKVRADARALKQILLNLLSNAIKFTPSGGEVMLRAALDKAGRPLIEVSDTGIGMAESDIPKALEVFGQIASPLVANQTGTGLGLPIVKSLAELHGGWLELESDPGRGTSATVRLPAKRIVLRRRTA